MGIAAPATALFITAGLSGVLLALLLPLVMWSRVHLRRHTPAQVAGGALLGCILTGFQLFLIKSIILS
jgi:membrane-associated phospholipid phosphatase